MGTHGYMPADSDGADEAVFLETEKIWERVEWRFYPSFCSSGYCYARVGLVQVLVERGFELPRRIAVLCLNDLNRCQKDDKWIGTWRSPETARKTIASLIRAFEGEIRAHEDRYKKSRGKARQGFVLHGFARRLARVRANATRWHTASLSEELKLSKKKARRRRKEKKS